MFSHWVNLFFGLNIYYPSGTNINNCYVIYYKYITPLGLKNEGILKGNELRRSVSKTSLWENVCSSSK